MSNKGKSQSYTLPQFEGFDGLKRESWACHLTKRGQFVSKKIIIALDFRETGSCFQLRQIKTTVLRLIKKCGQNDVKQTKMRFGGSSADWTYMQPQSLLILYFNTMHS